MSLGKNAGYLYVLFAVSAWGSLYVAGKIVLEVLPVTLVLALRYAIGLTLLLILSRKIPKATIQKGDGKYIVAVGAIAYYLGVTLQLLGTRLCDASLASLLNAMNPIIMVLLAVPLLGEILTGKKLLSVAITVLGAAVIIGGVSSGDFLGIIINLGSVTAWSFGSLMMRKVCLKYDALSVTIYSMALGLALAIPTAFVEISLIGFSFSAVTFEVVGWVLFIGIVCTAGALYAWNKGLSLLDAGTGSLFLPVQPMVATLLGVLILGETISMNFLLGSMLVLLGILYAVMPFSLKLFHKTPVSTPLGSE